MGDPAGVGPEICLRLLADETIARECRPVVIGDAAVLRQAAKLIGLPFAAKVVNADNWLREGDEPRVLDLAAMPLEGFTPGQISAQTGRAAFAYIDAAITAVLAKEIDAVTTAPISKEALHLAGIPFPGHTEIFASRAQARRSCMMQYSEEITCVFATVHVGYAEVPQLLSTARIVEVIELAVEALSKLGRPNPRLLVLGLNPHAGEHGLFGQGEEERIIQPAIDIARAKGLAVEGPIPPDTAFIPAKRRVTDAFVCMYHDQGHIPLKALAFDRAVNTTLGLPVIRTSVDHGTALDIAWQGKADPSSLFHAVRLAAKLVNP